MAEVADVGGARHEVRLRSGAIRAEVLGSGPPIVFVHGLLVHSGLWRNVAPRLARDFQCVLPDLPLGSHAVPMDESADLTPPGLAALLIELIDELGLEDVTLVGNDTGTAIAQIAVAQHPGRIARLVLTDGDAFDNFLPKKLRYLQWSARLPGSMWITGQVNRIRALWRSPTSFGLLSKRPVPEDVMRSYLDPLRADRGVRRDLRKVLTGISHEHTRRAAERLVDFRGPALLAWAREDKLFPFEHAERLAGLLPNARVAAIDDSWSFVPEDQPEQLAALIAEFLRDTASPAPDSERAPTSGGVR